MKLFSSIEGPLYLHEVWSYLFAFALLHLITPLCVSFQPLSSVIYFSKLFMESYQFLSPSSYIYSGLFSCHHVWVYVCVCVCLYMIYMNVCIHIDLIYTHMCITVYQYFSNRLSWLLWEHLESLSYNIVFKYVVIHILKWRASISPLIKENILNILQ